MRFFLFLFFWAGVAHAEISVRADIDYSTMTLEDEAQIQVVVSGGNATAPVAPNVPGLDIVQTGKSSQFSFINGKMSSNATYMYTVVADDPGQYEIPGFIVYSDGKEYQSNALKLTISAPQTHSSQNPVLTPQNQQKGVPDPQDPQVGQIQRQQNAGQAAPFWIATNVSKTNPYVSEQILYHFKFFSRVNVNNERMELPDFHDFYAQMVGTERRGREVVSGVAYATVEVVYALTPLKAGRIQIDKTVLPLTYREQTAGPGWDPFFGGKVVRKNLTAEAIAIDVQPLPEPRPADFTNLVGQFQLRADLPARDVKLGDSLTLTIEVAGTGNVTDARLPDWSIDGVKIYQNKPLVDAHTEDDGVHGVASFQVALVPTTAGEVRIPDLTLSTFDPAQGRYVAHVIPGATLTVAGEAVGQNSQTVFADTPASGQNPAGVAIRGLYEDVSGAQTFARRALAPPVFWVLLALPPAALLLLAIVRFLRGKMAHWGRSKKITRRTLARLQAALRQTDADSREIYQMTQVLLSQILGVDVSSRTPAEMVAGLKLRFPKREWGPFFKVLETLEQHSYGFGKVELTHDDRRDFLKILESLCQSAS